MNTINNNTSFTGGWKSLNAVNPISLYTNKYFSRSAKVSRQKFDAILPELSDKIKPMKIGNISAWDINPNQSKEYIFFLHGMAQNVSNYQDLYNVALKHNKGVFAVEYRGYGTNHKTHLSEDRLRNDVEKAYKYLNNKKGINPDDITVVGHSMGGALATNFASKHNDIKSLVLFCPITSLAYLGQKFTLNKNLGIGVPPFIKKLTDKSKLFRWMYNLRFNSVDKMAKVKTPTYILHSQNDSVTLLTGAKRLAAKARQQKVLQGFSIFKSGGHKVDSKKIEEFSNILDRIG